MTFARCQKIRFFTFYSAFLILLLLSGCTPDKPVDRTAYEQERSLREPHRLTPAEITSAGETLGNAVLVSVSEKFQADLKRAIVEKGIAGAIDYCNLNAGGIAKKLEDSLGISISRVTNKTRNPANQLSAIDTAIWSAYEYAPSTSSAQIQELNDETFILTKPISISSGLCLNCHGDPGSTITAENAALIQSRYPNDRATGYQTGDLRGMWRVIIPKKTAVQHMALN